MNLKCFSSSKYNFWTSIHFYQYKNLEIEIKKTSALKTITVPVMVETFDILKTERDKHIKNTAGNPSLYEMQKLALCGTAHLLKRILLIRLKIISKKKEKNNTLNTYNHDLSSC